MEGEAKGILLVKEISRFLLLCPGRKRTFSDNTFVWRRTDPQSRRCYVEITRRYRYSSTDCKDIYIPYDDADRHTIFQPSSEPLTDPMPIKRIYIVVVTVLTVLCVMSGAIVVVMWWQRWRNGKQQERDTAEDAAYQRYFQGTFREEAGVVQRAGDGAQVPSGPQNRPRGAGFMFGAEDGSAAVGPFFSDMPPSQEELCRVKALPMPLPLTDDRDDRQPPLTHYSFKSVSAGSGFASFPHSLDDGVPALHNPLTGSGSDSSYPSGSSTLTASKPIAIPQHMTSEEYAALNDATPVPSCDSPEAGPWYHARATPRAGRLPYSTCVGVEVGVRESLSRIIFLPVLPLLIIQENGVISSDTVGYQVCEEEYIYISSYTATLPYTPLSLVLNMCMKFYFCFIRCSTSPLFPISSFSPRLRSHFFWLRPVAHWHSLWWGCSDAGGTGLQHQTTIYQITGLTRHVSVSDSDSDVSPLLFVQREDRSFLFHFSSRFGYRYHTSPALLYAMKMGSIIIFGASHPVFTSVSIAPSTSRHKGGERRYGLFFFTSYFCGPTNLGNATRADSPAESTSFALSAALSKGPLLNLTLNPVSKRERAGHSNLFVEDSISTPLITTQTASSPTLHRCGTQVEPCSSLGDGVKFNLFKAIEFFNCRCRDHLFQCSYELSMNERTNHRSLWSTAHSMQETSVAGDTQGGAAAILHVRRSGISRIIFLPVLPLLIIQENGVISSDTVGYQVCEEEYIYIQKNQLFLYRYTALHPAISGVKYVHEILFLFYSMLHFAIISDFFFLTAFAISFFGCGLSHTGTPYGGAVAMRAFILFFFGVFVCVPTVSDVSVSDSDSDVSPLLFVQREDRSFLFHFSSRFGYRYHTSPALLYAMKMGSIIIFGASHPVFTSVSIAPSTSRHKGGERRYGLFFFTSYFCGPTNLGNATRADSPAESTSFALSAALSKGPLLNLTLNPVSKRERGGAL
eukprot:gene2074-1255_t